jgi:adenosine deaminase
MNLLVCTLGASWAVVPEVFGFLAPARLDLYAHHPQRPQLEALRAQHALAAPDELWIVTTEGEQTARSLAALRRWWSALGAPLPLRVWTAAGTDQLATQSECDHIRELILRVVMLAAERARQGLVVLSLAGGRKTMSADLQTAGSLFGAHAWLHVVGPEPMPEPLRKADDPLHFTRPLAEELAGAVMPLVVGRGSRNELLDIALDGRRVDSAAFSLALADPELRWRLPPDGAALAAEIDRRLREGSRLLGNFLGALAQAEPRENWRSLYRLPPARIDELRRTALAPRHRDWLLRLPKADLHRHLGGSLDLAAQRAVGRAIWQALDAPARAAALARVRPLLDARGDWPWDWPQQLAGSSRAACAAALLVEADDERLARNLYGVTEPRLQLKDSPRGFAAYERPGELTGSAVLTHPAAIEPYAQALVEQARAEGLAYVELRGSPHKYRPQDPTAFLRELRAALLSASGAGDEAPRFGFVWILDRRQRQTMPEFIAQAVAARAGMDDFLLGLDLAGAEGTQRPEELAQHFVPAFRDCLRITIHAGEGESAENIWQAAYHLHADRIGHGLTLLDNPRLAERFRDRGVCIELCPTSNREVVGFADPAVPASAGLPAYPLRGLLDVGLPLAICTDNPGISRTTLADEFIAAARMGGGLTLWEVLAVARAGFVHAFLPAATREALLARADAMVYQCTDTTGVQHRKLAGSPGEPDSST